MQALDALLSRYTSWEHDWNNDNTYEKFFDGAKRNFQSLIGKIIEVPFVGEVELVALHFTEPVGEDDYDTPFHQGYEGEGYIVILVDGEYYKKPADQNSYGNIKFRQVEDSWDEERYGLREARKVEKTIQVWE